MIVVPMKPTPITMISPALRSQDHGNPGRRAKGISHAELSAFCSEFDTPSAPMKIPIAAMASAIPFWLRWPMLPWSCGPMTGYWSTAAFSTLCCSSGLFLSTMSSTVTRRSSSGKIATSAE